MILGSEIYTKPEGVYFDCGYILDKDLPYIPKYRVVKGRYTSNNRNYYEVDTLVMEVNFGCIQDILSLVVNFGRSNKYVPYTGVWCRVKQAASRSTAEGFIKSLIENESIMDDVVNSKSLIYLASDTEVISDVQHTR